MSEEFQPICSATINSIPRLIDSHTALRRNGPIVETQMIQLRDSFYEFSNSVRVIWTNCAKGIENSALYHQNEYEHKKHWPNFKKIIASLKGKKNDKKASTLESIAEELGSEFFLQALLIQCQVEYQPSEKILRAISHFLESNTVLRWMSHLKRHYGEPDFKLEDNQVSDILEFLNKEDLEIDLPKIALGALAAFALLELDFDDESTFEQKCEEIEEKIEKACINSDESSLKVYEKRLEKLTWGPQNYQRDKSFITNAHTALRDNKIIAFYGLGGVGKTAIAQKLMFDIINNREPFTHIVTHSSKVGSDQKEINTISPKLRGTHAETNEKISVMESSLLEIRGVRVIGGLRMLLKKIYKEITSYSGDDYSDSQLQRRVFSELRNEENQVLIVIDNYEDIEDNQDDSDVLQIKDEIKEFLVEFSKLSNTKSRVIITTRSSPLDVAYGLEVKHLTKAESVQLFLEKIRFRALQKDSKDELRTILQETHQTFSRASDLKEELASSFDLWGSSDEFIAHPLLVLLAAEDVDKNDREEISLVISRWGERKKNEDIITYCVSKTLGSFKAHERELLKFLTQKSHLNSEISIQFLRDVIKENLAQEDKSEVTGHSIHDDLRDLRDYQLIDIMDRLCDRTFVRVVTKRSVGGTCWFWNKIVYEYLKYTRFKEIPISEKQEPMTLDDSALEELNGYFKPLYDWNNSTPGPIRVVELLTPLEQSIEKMLGELGNRVDGQELLYTLSSVEDNLSKQSFQLVTLLDNVTQYMTVDATLNGLKAKKPIEQVLELLLKCLGRQARCWRNLALIEGSNTPPAICIKYAVELLRRITLYSEKFHDARILNQKDYENLLLNIGKENIEIYESGIEISGTDAEYSTLQRLDWLQLSGKHFAPEDTTLTRGLELVDNQFIFFTVWTDVFQRTFLEDQNTQIALVEGYAFWVYLRLFATDKTFAQQFDVQILNQLKHNALYVKKVANIDQYIRSVQGDMDRALRRPSEYLDAVINFHSQPTNGTLMQTSIAYDATNSRWVKSLDRQGWKIVVHETNQGHDSDEYSRVILEQESFHRTNKKITCSFYRDDGRNIITEPEESMSLMAEVEKEWKNKIEEFVERRTREGRNEISLTEMMRLFKENNGPDAEKPVQEILNRICPSLHKIGEYYVINADKPHSPPPPEYQELAGWDKVFSSRWKDERIVLPLNPNVFAAYIETYFLMLDNDGNTYRKYRIKISDKYNDKVTHGTYYFYKATHKRHDPNWQEVSPEKLNDSLSDFVTRLEKSILHLCQRFNHPINKEVVKSYFRDVMAYFKSD